MQSTVVLLSLAALASATASPISDAFRTFEAMYNKTYATPEERHHRATIFAESSLQSSLQAAKTSTTSTSSAVYGITKFSDLTEDEFAQIYLSGYRRRDNSTAAAAAALSTIGSSAPVTIDWRSKGAVTAVKDQGHCGSCWAFSVVEQIESQGLQAGILKAGTTLSVEQMVDCDDFSHGCAGGSPETAYDYLTIGGGLAMASAYGPYIGNKTEKCHFSKSTAVIAAPDYPAYTSVSGDAGGEGTMYTHIQKSPMAICVQADIWKSYTGGVISATDNCGGQSADALNHCVQVVGIGQSKAAAGEGEGEGTASSSPYWIVRNSWGADFGNSGYVYLATGANVCGIAMEATVAKGLTSAASAV